MELTSISLALFLLRIIPFVLPPEPHMAYFGEKLSRDGQNLEMDFLLTNTSFVPVYFQREWLSSFSESNGGYAENKSLVFELEYPILETPVPEVRTHCYPVRPLESVRFRLICPANHRPSFVSRSYGVLPDLLFIWPVSCRIPIRCAVEQESSDPSFSDSSMPSPIYMERLDNPCWPRAIRPIMNLFAAFFPDLFFLEAEALSRCRKHLFKNESEPEPSPDEPVLDAVETFSRCLN